MNAIHIFTKSSSIATALLFACSLAGCAKLAEVAPPVTSTSQSNVYTDDATAASVLTGIYTQISQATFATGSLTSMSLFPGLSADELVPFTPTTNAWYIAYYTNALSNSNTLPADYWSAIYPTVFVANSAIQGLTASTSLTPAVKQQLMGEALFIRAFCYFYLVNLYGDVPLATGTDYTVNALLPRTPKAQVWQQIIADLKQAQGFLSPVYVDATVVNATQERTRPMQAVATALLARAYLYTADWPDAETQASAVINNTALYSLSPIDTVFSKNSSEAIWQLQPVNTGQNTQDGLLFTLPSSGPDNSDHPVYLSAFLLNAFEPQDQRRTNWIDSVIVGSTTYYYPYKYKVGIVGAPVTEYTMVLRLAEQYLIRAEARAEQGNIMGAQNDLDTIRNRAGLLPTQASTQTDLLTAILHERQAELFTEWGHRWLDLKRTGSLDAVMKVVTPQKGGTWNTDWQWYPILLSELQHDPNLVQNPGY